MTPLLVATLALAADPPSSEALVAVVVVDQEARESGYALALDGFLIDDALPVDVVEGDELVLVDPAGRTEPLDVAMGEAWEITGSDGEAWMSTLEEEVRTDVIAVRAPYRTVKRLAEALSAEIQVVDGVTYVAAPEVLYDLPWVEGVASRRLEEVRYVRVDELVEEAPSRTRDLRPAASRPAAALVAVGAPSAPLPAPEGRVAPTRAPARSEVVPHLVPHLAPDLPAPPAPVAVVAEVAPPPASVPDPPGDAAMEAHLAYAGLYLCRDQQLLLHPAGFYRFAGQTGEWTVGAPGVARLQGPDGELWYRAAVEPERGFCREVWTEADVLRGQAPQAKRRKGIRVFGPR